MAKCAVLAKGSQFWYKRRAMLINCIHDEEFMRIVMEKSSVISEEPPVRHFIIKQLLLEP